LQYTDSLLLAALRNAPRRYRMPPLPADAESAAASGTDSALAFAMEAARIASEEHGTPPPVEVRMLFTQALARLIQKALAPEDGDPAFQALVMQAQDAAVREHAQLWRLRDADQRAIRAAANAIAHPAKLRRMPTGELRDALAQLHDLASAGLWEALVPAIKNLLDRKRLEQKSLQPALREILSNPALERLARSSELLHLEAVQRYQALGERLGPAAGSDAALLKGRASARRGEAAEETSALALGKIADLMSRHDRSGASYRVVRSLRNPPAFPGEANKAKEEWDAAIVHGGAGDAIELVLLAEIKASPTAATADFSRLLRGLRRLAEASAGETYAFASADGPTLIHGESLRRLLPGNDSLPPHVIYCCSAAAEPRPPMLSAASKAVLMAEPASLEFAHRLIAGADAPPPDSLAAVWNALVTEPRLRAALHQYDTARKARAAMLHPADLLACAASQFDEARGASADGPP
jgi:hypothetical protein